MKNANRVISSSMLDAPKKTNCISEGAEAIDNSRFMILWAAIKVLKKQRKQERMRLVRRGSKIYRYEYEYVFIYLLLFFVRSGEINSSSGSHFSSPVSLVEHGSLLQRTQNKRPPHTQHIHYTCVTAIRMGTVRQIFLWLPNYTHYVSCIYV